MIDVSGGAGGSVQLTPMAVVVKDKSGVKILKVPNPKGGFEKLMERRSFIQNFTVVCRIAVPEPTFNEYLYSHAVEEISGIEIPERATWLRTMNLELMRLASFLMWIGGQGGAFGQYTVANWTLAYRDYVLDLFEEMTGARIYHMYIVPGGVRAGLPDGFEKRAREIMDGAEKLLDQVERVLFNNVVFKARSKGLGIISPVGTNIDTAWDNLVNGVSGLERVTRVAERMQLLTPGHGVITVAGTNGKGSSVAMLESI